MEAAGWAGPEFVVAGCAAAMDTGWAGEGEADVDVAVDAAVDVAAMEGLSTGMVGGESVFFFCFDWEALSEE